MKSLNTFQNNLNSNAFPLNTNSFQGSFDINSLMKLFDPSQLDTTILGKRQNSFINNSNFQPDLMKKVKLSTPAPFNFSGGSPSLPNFLLNSPTQFPQVGFGGNFNQELSKLQQLQTLSLLLNVNQGNLTNFPTPNLLLPSFNTMKSEEVKEKPAIKEKICMVKQEENSTIERTPSPKLVKPKKIVKTQETVNTEDTASEFSEEKDLGNVQFEEDESPLIELTKRFPDWDLATIFNFIRSGKSRQVFEKERLIKLENKKNRGRKGTKSTKQRNTRENGRTNRANKKLASYEGI